MRVRWEVRGEVNEEICDNRWERERWTHLGNEQYLIKVGEEEGVLMGFKGMHASLCFSSDHTQVLYHVVSDDWYSKGREQETIEEKRERIKQEGEIYLLLEVVNEGFSFMFHGLQRGSKEGLYTRREEGGGSEWWGQCRSLFVIKINIYWRSKKIGW